MHPPARSVLLVGVVVAATSCAPLIRDAHDAGISVEVRGCEIGARFVRATMEVTSTREPYDAVVILAELRDAAGVVSHTSEAAHDVDPDQVYRLQTTLRVLRPVEGTATCDARLGYANPPGP